MRWGAHQTYAVQAARDGPSLWTAVGKSAKVNLQKEEFRSGSVIFEGGTTLQTRDHGRGAVMVCSECSLCRYHQRPMRFLLTCLGSCAWLVLSAQWLSLDGGASHQVRAFAVDEVNDRLLIAGGFPFVQGGALRANNMAW